MKTILVVDDMPGDRSPIAAKLCTAGYRAIGVGSGTEALEVLRRDTADLIFLDVMNSLADALALLRNLRSDSATANIPVIMLSSDEHRKHVVSAGQIGIQGYVLRSSFSFEDLLRRVQNQVEASSPKPSSKTVSDPPVIVNPPRRTNRPDKLLTRQACIDRTEQALEGKTLAGIAAQVIAMAASSQGDVNELARLAARDAMLSTRILQVANSAVYRAGRPVSTVVDAIRQIGFCCVRNIAASIGIYDAMPASSPDGFNPLLCWRHSFAVATLCERLVVAGRNTDVVSRHAYLVGLCHDLGEVLLRVNFAREFQTVIDEQARTGLPRKDVERAVLGISHGELVVTILQKLGLPDVIRNPIEVFHNGGLPYGPNAERLLNLLKLAERGANSALLLAGEDADVEPITTSEFVAATGIEETPSIDWHEFRQEISAKTVELARLSPEECAKLTLPFQRSQASRVWVARDPQLCPFDPVTAALQSMAQQVTIYNELPPGEIPKEYDRVVILARNAAVPGFTARDIANFKSANSRQLPSILWLVEHPNTKKLRGTDSALPSPWQIPLSSIAKFAA